MAESERADVEYVMGIKLRIIFIYIHVYVPACLYVHCVHTWVCIEYMCTVYMHGCVLHSWMSSVCMLVHMCVEVRGQLGVVACPLLFC